MDLIVIKNYIINLKNVQGVMVRANDKCEVTYSDKIITIGEVSADDLKPLRNHKSDYLIKVPCCFMWLNKNSIYGIVFDDKKRNFIVHSGSRNLDFDVQTDKVYEECKTFFLNLDNKDDEDDFVNV